MNHLDPNNSENLSAAEAIERFAARFGQPELYRELAQHAALPFLLTPELLNSLRSEFLADRVDWVAEADLLLSDLCQEVGYEQFAMRLDVRALLLKEAETALGEERLEAIARRVLGWVAGQIREGEGFGGPQLQNQQWGAMVYLKEKREQAAREIAEALARVSRVESRFALANAAAFDAEALRLSHVVLQLRDRLGDFPELIAQAEQTTRLLLDAGATAARVLPGASAIAPAALPTVAFTFETIRLDAKGKEVKGSHGSSRRTLTARQFIETLAEGVTLEMIELPGGTFTMGAPKSEENSYEDERPQHQVTVAPFFIGKFTVTQAQWRTVAGWQKEKIDLDLDPSRFKGDDRPVETVSWDEAKEFCARLAKQTGNAYRLPSEAEWEYACRAATTSPFAFGETITNQVANYSSENPYAEAPKEKSRGETITVGSLGFANDFGLFDMHGNVWEWCEDAWHNNYDGAPEDSSAWLSGDDSSGRVVRGGSWGSDGNYCRCAYRGDLVPGNRNFILGVRVVVAARTA